MAGAAEPERLPLACTLSAAGQAERLERMRRLADRALRGREDVPGGRRLRFAAMAGVEAELRELVAAQRKCCAFLELTVTRTRDEVVLTVTAPAEARPVVEALFA